jgi:DNA-binding transcriptional MocR family regulator
MKPKRRMLMRWSQRYVEAFYKSESAREPLLCRFRRGFERDRFIHLIALRKFYGVRVEQVLEGADLCVRGAGPTNTIEIVNLATQAGGEVVFPGPMFG